jgi:hypothetical protein
MTKTTYTSNWWFPEGETHGTTVYEHDEVQLTQLLGPDGKPYAIRRPKFKMGFDLTPQK